MSTAPARLTVKAVTRRYGGRPVVDGASLTLEPGRILALMGASGCGKSTLVRLIAGLEPVDGGEIARDGQSLSAPGRTVPPERRGIGVVFQDYALFPHLTVRANVAFGLRGQDRAGAADRVERLLEALRLRHRDRAYPGTLSGGEQQRVALARTLAREPGVILLDEPFSGLDGPLKAEVREATLSALRASGATAMIVTHDAEEALRLADDLALMDAGRILQSGQPRDLYLRPVSLVAARLLGEVEALAAQVRAGVAETAFGAVPAPGLADGPAVVAARPEALISGETGAEARLSEIHFLGSGWTARVCVGDQSARMRHPGLTPPPEATRIRLDPERCAVFAA